MFVDTKELPDCVKRALASVGFHKPSVAVKAAETFTVASHCAFEGNRAHTVAVNLSTGEHVKESGAWNGANPFAAAPADHDKRERALLPGFVVIQGESGGRGAFFEIFAHPETMAKVLTVGESADALTADEQTAINTISGYKASYRKAEYERMGWTPARIEATLSALAAKGLVTRNKAGATQITTAGKNRVSRRGY